MEIFHGKHTADGAFRFDDVPAGDYQLFIQIKRTPPEPISGIVQPPIATARRDITVPEIPGGRSDDPLDIGVIAVEPKEKP